MIVLLGRWSGSDRSMVTWRSVLVLVVFLLNCCGRGASREGNLTSLLCLGYYLFLYSTPLVFN